MYQGIKRLFHVAFILALVAIVAIARVQENRSRLTSTAPEGLILIDPGHGGEDGGASAADGTLEKTINLEIALDLRDLMTLFGFPVEMTRVADVSIHDADCTTTRQMKVSDMNNRLKQYNAAAVTVSIHQNHFSVSKYCGTQVFYSTAHPLGAQLAASVRESVITYLQPQNTREIKAATDNIFLLHRTVKPAILVECGFLSNEQERDRLKQSDYQKQLAMTILAGLLDVYQHK